MSRIKSAGQLRWEAVKRRYPEVYVCPGLGICGPGWQAATEYARELESAHVEA